MDHFIDALYFYDKEIAIKERLEQLVKTGIEAKQNSIKGINNSLADNVFKRNVHMPTVWQYCFLLGSSDHHFAKSINSNAFKLQENTRRRIKCFDLEIICFLAVDNFIKSIPNTITKVKSKLKDPSNAIENSIRTLNLHALDFIILDTTLHNFSSGLGKSIENYIKMRNAWASWIDIPAMTRPKYEECILPDLNIEF